MPWGRVEQDRSQPMLHQLQIGTCFTHFAISLSPSLLAKLKYIELRCGPPHCLVWSTCQGEGYVGVLLTMLVPCNTNCWYWQSGCRQRLDSSCWRPFAPHIAGCFGTESLGCYTKLLGCRNHLDTRRWSAIALHFAAQSTRPDPQ